MRNSFAVRRSRTRSPTISFSVSSLGTATSCTQVSPRATLRTQSTRAALVTLRYTTPCAPFVMCRCALSPVSSSTITRVFALFAATTIAAKSLWNPAATTSTAARNLSRAMNICSGVWAWATIRISSSTASTLAMPARKIAWLSARISLSMLSALQESLFPHELVRVDHAGHAAAFSTASGCVGAHHSPLALDGHILLTARHFRGQRDFKFHRRTNLHRGIGADVHPCRAEIPRNSFGVSAGLALVYLDRQF